MRMSRNSSVQSQRTIRGSSSTRHRLDNPASLCPLAERSAGHSRTLPTCCLTLKHSLPSRVCPSGSSGFSEMPSIWREAMSNRQMAHRWHMTRFSLLDRLAQSRVSRSVFRHGWPDNALDRSLVMTSNVFLHLHPVKVNRKSLKWSYSFGLGIISSILFGVLVFTGILLMFYYVPSVERAYTTMKEIQLSVPLGQCTRNMHGWSAHVMVLVVILHMARVFYVGAYKPPREFNWVVGVMLLLLTMGASFTGYLLPWDQLSYWAITVGTNIASYAPVAGSSMREMLLGGTEVGQNALIRFYTLHVALIPLLITLLVSLHVWRVRKDGGLAVNDLGERS